MNLFKKYVNTLLVVFVLLFTSSCMLIPELKFWLSRINVTSDTHINKGTIVQCDVVACYSDAIAAEFREMTASQYFVNKEKLLKKYSEDIQIVANIIIKPGNTKEANVKLKSYSKAKGLFFYAKYRTDVAFALSLGKEPVITVHLKESEVIQYPGPVRNNALTGSCMLIPELKFWLSRINVTSDTHINKGTIVQCDVVACYSDAIAAEFREMTASQYFVNKEKLLKKYSEDIQIVANIIIKPGNTKEANVKLKSYSKAKGLFFYAKYRTDVAFALSLGKEPVITVHLKESEVIQYPGPVRNNALTGASNSFS